MGTIRHPSERESRILYCNTKIAKNSSLIQLVTFSSGPLL
jgi:hypothetical protein